jgi:hypothetical protein
VNEKIFEVSLAAERVKSMFAISAADLISDFVLAEHGVRSGCCHPKFVVFIN